MSTPRFDLIEIIQTIRHRIRFVVLITLLAAVAGAAFHLLKKKQYTAEAEIIVANPLYADRFAMYGNDQHPMDYFGSDEDLDKIIMLAQSDTVQNTIIRNLQLDTAYDIKVLNPETFLKLKKLVNKDFDIKRTEYRSLELSYTDKRPQLAADIANEYIKILEENFRGYYNNMRLSLYLSIKDKVHEEDSTINALTDTLALLRDKYGIYDIISPARNNLMLSSVKSTGHGDFGRGVEEIQNVEALKDQVVTDRARHATLMNQYSTGTKINEMHLVQIITSATPPVKAKGLSGIMTVFSATLLGFFFSILFVLITAYTRALISKLN